MSAISAELHYRKGEDMARQKDYRSDAEKAKDKRDDLIRADLRIIEKSEPVEMPVEYRLIGLKKTLAELQKQPQYINKFYQHLDGQAYNAAKEANYKAEQVISGIEKVTDKINDLISNNTIRPVVNWSKYIDDALPKDISELYYYCRFSRPGAVLFNRFNNQAELLKLIEADKSKKSTTDPVKKTGEMILFTDIPYRIRKNEYNYIIEVEKEVEKKDGSKALEFAMLGYYPNFIQALLDLFRTLVDNKVAQCNAGNIKDVIQAIREAEKHITGLIQKGN